MKNKRIRILAIDPGTKKMGVAVLEGEELIYHGVKVFLRRRTPHENLREGRETVLRLLRDFTPRILAVENTFATTNRRIALLHVLTDEIKALAKREGVIVRAYAPSTVKKYICGNGRGSKGAVAAVVAHKYPELSVYVSQNRKWKMRHHANMFDAVAVGLMAYSHL